MFKRIETDQALVVQKGVYKPADVYEGPEGGLYVKVGSGFVRVSENGGTSVPTVSLYTLHRDEPIFRDRFGRLCVSNGNGRKPVKLSLDTEGRALIGKE